uniref:Ubiquitin-activating enzyme E1 C-terminal domain-containing protein n=1 Tax=Parascaris univalens TaxID=6257 RepID=A0A915CCT0_PARUN
NKGQIISSNFDPISLQKSDLIIDDDVRLYRFISGFLFQLVLVRCSLLFH